MLAARKLWRMGIGLIQPTHNKSQRTIDDQPLKFFRRVGRSFSFNPTNMRFQHTSINNPINFSTTGLT